MGPDWASASRRLAEQHLAGMRMRLAHVAAVASKIEVVAPRLANRYEIELTAAAWLHDIGYAPAIRRTGFHALDGARFLESHGYPRLVCQLVGYHSGAEYEAAVRGLSVELAQLPMPDTCVLDLMTWADMTTSPTGAAVSVTRRVEEILTRYPESDPVHQAITAAEPTLAGAVERVEARLGKLLTD
jgi:hypothetical protein